MKKDTDKNTTFSKFFRDLLDSRELTIAKIDKSIGISKQTLYSIENGDSPSLKTIGKLIQFFCNNNNDPISIIEKQKFSLLILGAALGIDLYDNRYQLSAMSVAEEENLQETLDHGSEVWVISDKLIELESEGGAKMTADLIREKNIKYSYFLPFDNSSYPAALIASLQNQLNDDLILENHVAVYQLSDICFSSRIRITNPLSGTDRNAVYSLVGQGKSNFLFYEMPQDLLSKTVDRIKLLINLYHADINIRENTEKFPLSKLGAIKMFFPEDGKHKR